MRLTIEKEKEIERNKIEAYAVNHLPIIKEFPIKLGLVEAINQGSQCQKRFLLQWV